MPSAMSTWPSTLGSLAAMPSKNCWTAATTAACSGSAGAARTGCAKANAASAAAARRFILKSPRRFASDRRADLVHPGPDVGRDQRPDHLQDAGVIGVELGESSGVSMDLTTRRRSIGAMVRVSKPSIGRSPPGIVAASVTNCRVSMRMP